MNELDKNMSVEEFERGCFHATESKTFAKAFGTQVGTSGKNEVEEHMQGLSVGKIRYALTRKCLEPKE